MTSPELVLSGAVLVDVGPETDALSARTRNITAIGSKQFYQPECQHYHSHHACLVHLSLPEKLNIN